MSSVEEIDVAKLSFTIKGEMVKNQKQKSELVRSILAALCALCNSRCGGIISLLFESSSDVSYLLRNIEQRSVALLGVAKMRSLIKLDPSSKPNINVKPSRDLVTLDYKLYIPSQCQVLSIPSTETFATVRAMVNKELPPGDCVVMKSHEKVFFQGVHCTLRESETVQMKQLKGSPSKCVSFADRLAGRMNKFNCYVSAFANLKGGHIYYGVNDTGLVEGVVLDGKEIEDTKKKVTKAMTMLLWANGDDRLEKGRHWDIFFELVRDETGEPVPSTFVVVVFVARCPGGVFVGTPESCELVDRRVVAMSWKEWLGRFREEGPLASIRFNVSRLSWSSEKNRSFYRKLTAKLVHLRNNDKMMDFNNLCQLAKREFSSFNARLIVYCEKIMVETKRLCFKKVDHLSLKFKELLASPGFNKDVDFFEGRMLLLQSIAKSTMGDYKSSHDLIQMGLTVFERIPVESATVWFYTQAAMVSINAWKSRPDTSVHQVDQSIALHFLSLASDAGKLLGDAPGGKADMRQKLHIYKAFLLLGSSVSGDELKLKREVNEAFVEQAERELLNVYQLSLKGESLSNFREVQFLLAKCDLLCRQSQRPTDSDCFSKLKRAFEYGTKARALSTKHLFSNMVEYSNTRLGNLTEKLVRLAWKTREKRGRTFLGFSY